MRAEVCSLYLVDRDGAGLTLAATNGVDREHIGVARLEIGQGITGLVASTRGAVLSTDLANDPRCAWIRGVDHERFTSILAVPLEVGDRVVGVLNVKTEARREFDESEIRRLATIASLLAGVVERRRLHLETEAQLDGLRSVDQARAELIAVVTHQLRTPLAVVRAYLDLLAETADPARAEEVTGWHEAATGQVLRLNDLVDTILETVRADRLLTVEIRRFDVGAVIDEVLTRLAPLLRRHRLERYATGSRMALGDPARLAQVLELLLDGRRHECPRLGRERGGLGGAFRLLAAADVAVIGVGIEGDILYGPRQVHALVDAARSAGTDASYREIRSDKGHDAFLVEWDQVTEFLREALSREDERVAASA